MISARGILLRRHLRRLRANRSVLVGVVLALLLLMLVALGGYTVARAQGTDGPELAFLVQARLWQLGNPFSVLVAALAIVLGSSMVNDDIRMGTIFGILARPISRADYFLGSWLGSALVAVGIEALRCVTAAAIGLALGGSVPASFVLATVAVLAGVLLRLALFAALGAFLSTGAAVLTGLVLFVVENVAFLPSLPAWVAYPLRAVAVFLPLPSQQERMVGDGVMSATHDLGPLLEIVGYRLAWTAALLALGILAFRRRNLSPRT